MPAAYLRDFRNPLEGLQLQLEELEGFARTVPPLISAHWKALWDDVMSQPGDPDEDPLDVYGKAAGKGTGGGFADFERTAYVASLVLGFEAFKDYLALHLVDVETPGRRLGRVTMRDELEIETTALAIPDLLARYKALGIRLTRLTGWGEVEEIQHTRNALVHNHGRYTPQYFNAVKIPRFPTKDDTHGMDYTRNMSDAEKKEWLIDREDIPLGFEYVSASLKALTRFAELVDSTQVKS